MPARSLSLSGMFRVLPLPNTLLPPTSATGNDQTETSNSVTLGPTNTCLAAEASKDEHASASRGMSLPNHTQGPPMQRCVPVGGHHQPSAAQVAPPVHWPAQSSRYAPHTLRQYDPRESGSPPVRRRPA